MKIHIATSSDSPLTEGSSLVALCSAEIRKSHLFTPEGLVDAEMVASFGNCRKCLRKWVELDKSKFKYLSACCEAQESLMDV